MLFADRADAGRKLAEAVAPLITGDVIVLALPRGGVPVAAEVAERIGAELDIIGVRKIGAPGHPELGVGAVAEGGGVVLDGRTLAQLGLSPADLAGTIERERREVARRVEGYRGDRPLPDLKGRTVVVVDDGLATGVTARAAVRAVRAQGAARVILAVPVSSVQGRDELAAEVDEIVCVEVPASFRAVGQWYQDFGQTSDEEVLAALERVRGASR